MEMEFLQNELEGMAELIGLPEEVRKKLKTANWQEVLSEAGVETFCMKKRVNFGGESKDQDSPLVLPGAHLVAISTLFDETRLALVQVMNSGKAAGGKREIGVPGGASDMWRYKDKVVPEHPLVTAYRKFAEEVGVMVNYPASYLCYTCTTTPSDDHPKAYATRMYYMAYVPYDEIEAMAKKINEAEERKVMLVPVRELQNYRWNPNAVDAFRIIRERYYI